jgi:hypothetical protein
MENGQNTAQLGTENGAEGTKVPGPPLRRGRARSQLLTRDQLDGRTNAAKLFDRLVSEIENDLGGHDQLSCIERALVEAFVGATVTLHSINTKLALGQSIDVTEHAPSGQCHGAGCITIRIAAPRPRRNYAIRR